MGLSNVTSHEIIWLLLMLSIKELAVLRQGLCHGSCKLQVYFGVCLWTSLGEFRVKNGQRELANFAGLCALYLHPINFQCIHSFYIFDIQKRKLALSIVFVLFLWTEKPLRCFPIEELGPKGVVKIRLGSGYIYFCHLSTSLLFCLFLEMQPWRWNHYRLELVFIVGLLVNTHRRECFFHWF